MTRITRAVLAAAATLALLAIALPASASPAHVIPRIPDDRTELARIISEHAGTIDSGNWAGYAATGRIFRDISATYQVPSVNCTTTPNAFAYQWIGLDGLSNSTVEQDGVAGYCQSGTPTYFAWSEMYPAGVVIQFYLDPGDAVTSAVRYSGGTFTLSMTDLTSGQSFSQAATCAGACDRSSAEVISEGYPDAPEYGGTADYGLENYSAISLTDGRNQTGSFTDSKWSLTKIVQVGDSGTDASPGPLYAGAAFANTWLNED